jgi:GNAT superfamily N-acetyltransferase
MTLELVKVSNPSDWEAFHRIRRTVLFAARGRVDVYDPNHPDDRAPPNHPLLMVEEGRPRATARLDFLGDHRAAIRLVAVEPENQRRGLGRAMMTLVEQYAARHGVVVLEVNSAPDAAAFYQKLGWTMVHPDREHPLLERHLGAALTSDQGRLLRKHRAGKRTFAP